MNKKNEKGLTPLLIASMNNDTEIVKLLLDYANASNSNINLELNEQDYKHGFYLSTLIFHSYK